MMDSKFCWKYDSNPLKFCLSLGEQAQMNLNWSFLIAVIDRHTEVHTLPSLSRDPDNAVQKSAQEGDMELLDPTVTTTTPSTEVDLKDPNKYCVLCAASFNNPQMALQHYNGRKHQRNQTRQELLKELGDQQGNTGSCLPAKQYNIKPIRPLMWVEWCSQGTFIGRQCP